MRKMRKILEGIYPFAIPIAIVIFLWIGGNKYIDSVNMNSALEAIITTASIIIGFIGAILPVIVGMKNNSKLVKRVFELDKNKLFLKYIKHTLITGVLLIICSVILFYRDQFPEYIKGDYVLIVTTYLLVAFLLCTYRCLKIMLDLLFLDDEIVRNEEKYQEKSEEEIEFEERHTK